MKISSTDYLSEEVRTSLPPDALSTYDEAFENAYEEYEKDKSRAHEVAWAAVEQAYYLDDRDDRWKKK